MRDVILALALSQLGVALCIGIPAAYLWAVTDDFNLFAAMGW